MAAIVAGEEKFEVAEEFSGGFFDLFRSKITRRRDLLREESTHRVGEEREKQRL